LGWLNQVGVAAEAENRGEKVYAFYHPTFQEYFAAQAISDWHYFLNHTPHNPAQGTYRIFEPQWKEVILLWLGREDVPYQQKENLSRRW
jgi:predicted NACHT family NTPase